MPAPFQVITVNPLTQSKTGGQTVIFDVNYSTSDNDNTLPGLGLLLFYDSTQLNYTSLTNVLSNDLLAQGTPQPDTTNQDGDASTDSFVNVAWTNFSGNWPNVALPTKLYTANFTTVPNFTGSAVNFFSDNPAAGYTLKAPGFDDPGAAGFTPDPPVLINVLGTPGSVSFNTVASSGNEGNSGSAVNQVIATVQRTGGSSGAISVPIQLAASPGTATAGSDYTNTLPITVNFADGDTTSKTVSIPIVGDTTVEPDETINLQLGAPTGGATLGSQTTTTYTILNDDANSGTVSFTSTALSGNEGNSGSAVNQVIATVQRTGGSSGAISVPVQLAASPGTATAGSDYTNALPITVNFANGDTASKTVSIPIIGDTVNEPTETINLQLGTPTGGATLGSQSIATYSILNDDAPSGLLQQVTPDFDSITVGNQTTRGFSPNNPVSFDVNYSTSDNDNTLPGLGLLLFYDSTQLNYTSLTNVLSNDLLAQGTPQPDTTNQDGDASTDSFVNVAWTNFSGNWPNVALPTKLYTANFTASPSFTGSTVNFFSNNTAAGYTLSPISAVLTFNNPSTSNLAIAPFNAVQTEGSAGTKAFTFTVTRSGIITGTTNVNYAITGNSANPADAADFGTAFPTGTVSFTAGQTSKVITVNVKGDTIAEPDEGFAVTLSNPTNGATITTSSTTGTIVNDDTSLVIAADPSAIQPEGNSGSTPFTFTVTRNGVTTGNTNVNWAVTGGTTNPVNAADFVGNTLPKGTVSFAAGEISKMLTVNVNGDTKSEPNENFVVTLSTPTGGATLTTAKATGIIQNDDPVNLAIAADPSADRGEGNTGTTTFTFTVTRSGDTTGTTSAKWAVTGSGTNPANAADFGTILPTGTVSFTAGQTSKVITVNVKGDIALEPDENFTVTLSNPTVGTTITTATATGTIRNDDTAPTFAIAPTNANQVEGTSGNKAFTFTVTRTGDTTAANNVSWAVTGIAPNPADAIDFGGTLPSGTLSFTAGQTSKVITVNVKGDTTPEQDENFAVTLLNSTNGAIVGADTATGTIKNDDPILGTASNDTLPGTIGNDTISGLAGNDAIDGLGGNDSIQGGTGSDYIIGGSGNDIIDGGSGNDTIFGIDGNDSIQGGIDNDLLIASSNGNNTLLGGQGKDTIFGSVTGSNIINGDLDDDLLIAGSGGDRLLGGTGNDILLGGTGSDSLFGGAGSDEFLFSTAIPTAFPPFMSAGEIVLAQGGFGGSDTINDFSTADKIFINQLDRNATVSFTNITGGVMITIAGTSGNGQPASQTMKVVGVTRDNILAPGVNIVAINGLFISTNNTSNSGNTSTFIVGGGISGKYLSGSEVSDAFDPNPDLATVVGGILLTTTVNDDTLLGNGGGDFMNGGAGNDNINGGNGDDTLIGGPGFDTLTGATGADVFRFTTFIRGEVDTITDYRGATDADTIAISAAVFGGSLIAGESAVAPGTGSALNYEYLAASGIPTPASGLGFSVGISSFYYDTDSGSLYFDRDGGGTGAVFVKFAQMSPLPSTAEYPDPVFLATPFTIIA